MPWLMTGRVGMTGASPRLATGGLMADMLSHHHVPTVWLRRDRRARGRGIIVPVPDARPNWRLNGGVQ